MTEKYHKWNDLWIFGLDYGKKEKTLEMPWMEKVHMEMNDRVQVVSLLSRKTM